jgi:hypothetical protein
MLVVAVELVAERVALVEVEQQQVQQQEIREVQIWVVVPVVLVALQV